MNLINLSPIEGFFIKTIDDMIFDVKGITHPSDRIFAFVRYVPYSIINEDKRNTRKGYCKIYDLNKRYDFLDKFFPNYLFMDPQGRGLMQAIQKDSIEMIYNPCLKLKEIEENIKQKTEIEKVLTNFTRIIKQTTRINPFLIGISGSILVNLHTKKSDIDIVVYGKKNGQKLFEKMPEIINDYTNISKYSDKDLRKLWKQRGQNLQISFDNFIQLEKNKRLQGKISNFDFYIRLVQLPDEYYEPYLQTKIKSLAVIEIEAIIINDENSIFTPTIYEIKITKCISQGFDENSYPRFIFSLRGRYTNVVKTGDKIRVKGKLEQVIIGEKQQYLQLVLGNLKDEFLIKL